MEILNAELKDAISKKKRLLKVCKSLDHEFVELVKKTEETDDMSLVVKANGIKRKNEERFVTRRSDCNNVRKKEETTKQNLIHLLLT